MGRVKECLDERDIRFFAREKRLCAHPRVLGASRRERESPPPRNALNFSREKALLFFIFLVFSFESERTTFDTINISLKEQVLHFYIAGGK